MKDLEAWELKILGGVQAFADPEGRGPISPETKAALGEHGTPWSIPLVGADTSIGCLVLLQKIKNAKTIEEVKNIFAKATK